MSWFIRWIKDRVDWKDFCYTLHFFCSIILVIIGIKFGLTRMQAVGVAVVIGMLKELIDVMILHKMGDLMDIVSNLCGAAVGWLLIQ